MTHKKFKQQIRRTGDFIEIKAQKKIRQSARFKAKLLSLFFGDPGDRNIKFEAY